MSATLLLECLAQDGTRPLISDSDQAFIQRVLNLTNEYRKDNGLPPLRVNRALTSAADWMARDMAKNQYIDHTDKLGRKLPQRLKDFSYSYSAAGENLAAGQTTPEQVLQSWIKSPGHRANLLNREFTEIGIGFAFAGGKLQTCWVQDFGCPME